MGAWDIMPWQNDQAADWYGDVMDTCKIRNKWLEGINANLHHEYDTVRAAIWLFTCLGRIYVWSIEFYDEDLALAISKCESLQNHVAYKCDSALIDQIGLELTELKSRASPS